MKYQIKLWFGVTGALGTILTIIFSSSFTTQAQTISHWHVETVNAIDRCPNIDVSLASNDQGQVHISYNDADKSALKHSQRSQSGWITEVVQQSPGAGMHSSIALDSLGYPHISYRDGANNDLKYAQWDGVKWNISTIGNKDSGWYTSLVLDDNDQAHISYLGHDETAGGQSPKYAYWSGNAWELSVIDPIFAGSGTSLALDSKGNPHVSYYVFRELRYAVYEKSQWITQTVDLPVANDRSAGFYSSIAVDDADAPHISYGLYSVYPMVLGLAPNDLKYAKLHENSWTLETVDSMGRVGTYSSLAVDTQNHSHIIYFDRDTQSVKYAYWDGNIWSLSTIDSPVRMEGYTSVEIDRNGQPHTAYCDELTGIIKYARLITVEVNNQIYLPLTLK